MKKTLFQVINNLIILFLPQPLDPNRTSIIFKIPNQYIDNTKALNKSSRPNTNAKKNIKDPNNMNTVTSNFEKSSAADWKTKHKKLSEDYELELQKLK